MPSVPHPEARMSWRGNCTPSEMTHPSYSKSTRYHNLKVPELSKSSFTLGDWEVTCCRIEKDDDYQSAKVGRLAEETTTEKVHTMFRLLDREGGRHGTGLNPSTLPAEENYREVAPLEGAGTNS